MTIMAQQSRPTRTPCPAGAGHRKAAQWTNVHGPARVCVRCASRQSGVTSEVLVAGRATLRPRDTSLPDHPAALRPQNRARHCPLCGRGPRRPIMPSVTALVGAFAWQGRCHRPIDPHAPLADACPICRAPFAAATVLAGPSPCTAAPTAPLRPGPRRGPASCPQSHGPVGNGRARRPSIRISSKAWSASHSCPHRGFAQSPRAAHGPSAR